MQVRPLSETIHDFPYAALLCDRKGVVIVSNARLQSVLGVASGDNLTDYLYDPQSQDALDRLLRTDATLPGETRLVLRLCRSNGDEPNVFLADMVETSVRGADGHRRHILLRAITTAWDDIVITALQTAFQLTPAELGLVENLYRGLSVREISEKSQRSQATLRTQLSSVLSKTGAKGQADLMRMVSGLVQVLQQGIEHARPAARPASAEHMLHQRSSVITMSDGRTMEFIESGDLAGRPVYFIQTSSAPHLTPELIRAFRARKIRLVSPMRSGLGGTDLRPTGFYPRDWARCHLEALQRMDIDPRVLGAHRCGGVYAMELARLLGSACRKLVLFDTGAPLRNVGMINQMPPAPKRLFLAARFFPPAISTPIKLVAQDFFSGQDGEDRAVAYFFDGSPADQKLMSDHRYWQATRDNIEYCLHNAMQTAKDVVHWSRDTTPLLQDVVQHSHVSFVHGSQNLMHRAQAVSDLCANTSNTSAHIVQGLGQLLIYVAPDLVADTLLTALDENPL
jgi:pimeloyl-ACP methyl ester carboxylesterase/DNA-binding CsgD family transcriptional regulator